MQARVVAGWITQADLDKGAPLDATEEAQGQCPRMLPCSTTARSGQRLGAPSAGPSGMCGRRGASRRIDDLIRFVVAPDGRGRSPDLKRKLPGRGLWVTASPQER